MRTDNPATKYIYRAIALSLSFVFASYVVFEKAAQASALEAMTPVERVSVDLNDAEGNGSSEHPAISADGRYVAFYSDADNLVDGDTNGDDDIFRKDMQTGEIIRVSTDSDGGEANERSFEPSISADGRYIAFVSYASNLVDNDTNNQYDVFVKDIQTGVISRASTTSAGVESNSGNQGASISPDGRYVAFASFATNLVANDTNGQRDVFLKDLVTGETDRVSVDQSGVEANSHSRIGDFYSGGKVVSTNGQYVIFQSNATNLVSGGGYSGIVVKNLQTGEVTRVTDDDGGYGGGSITSNGRFVALAVWYGSDVGVAVMDLQTQVIERVDTSAEGNLSDNEAEYDPSISADGRYVVFSSYGSNLVSGDTNNNADTFVKDRATGDIARVSTSTLGAEANDYNYEHSISADGRYIVFSSYASNIVSGDTNNEDDIFFRANPFATILQDEDFSSTPISAGSNSDSALGNATKNGSPIDSSEYILSITDDDGLSGATINADGTITIPDAAESGTYNLTYEACEVAAPDYCISATVQMAVLGASTDDGENEPEPDDTEGSTGNEQTPGVPDTGSPVLFTSPLVPLTAAALSGVTVAVYRRRMKL